MDITGLRQLAKKWEHNNGDLLNKSRGSRREYYRGFISACQAIQDAIGGKRGGGMPVLIAATRFSPGHSWCLLHAAGRTEQVNVENIILCPCVDKSVPEDRAVRVSFEEKILGEGEHTYKKLSATIYGEITDLEAVCASIGLGTPSNPVPVWPDEREE